MVRLTARINNRQITAESSVFKHSLKSHQPRGEANEDRGGGGREGGKAYLLQQRQQQQQQQCRMGKIHAKLQKCINLCSLEVRLCVLSESSHTEEHTSRGEKSKCVYTCLQTHFFCLSTKAAHYSAEVYNMKNST